MKTYLLSNIYLQKKKKRRESYALCNCFTLFNAFELTWMTEGNEQKKKRMKGDSDIPRLSPSMRNQQEFFASLKGEQV